MFCEVYLALYNWLWVNLNYNFFSSIDRPWHKNYMLQSKEIPKFSHRLLFFISYSLDSSESDDFPEIVMNGNLALALIIL